MIIKQRDTHPVSTSGRPDIFLAAGTKAEKDLAFYLHRAFAATPDVCVLNDIRLQDEHQPDPDGSPGTCQVDHLVLHQWGAFIIESKSVCEEILVRPDGSGGDEWARVYQGKPQGMPSPIQQANRQANFLRAYLQRHRERILSKVTGVSGLLTKLITGTDQRGFTHMPMQIIIAISDKGSIERLRGWTEPTKPFRTFVAKADLVPDKVSAEIQHHQSASKLTSQDPSGYGVWVIPPADVVKVGQFLAAKHTPKAC
jgi:hypothetical protein